MVRHFAVSLAANPGEIRKGLGEIRAILATARLSVEALDRVEIVLAEILNNIAEHAYPNADDGLIEIEGDIFGDVLVCRTVDWGRQMPGGVLPPCEEADLRVAVADLPEGGFGWFMIHTLTQDLRYARIDDKNELRFQVPLSKVIDTEATPSPTLDFAL